MTTGAEWQAQLGRNWAAMYAYTDRSFSELTGRLLERIGQQAAASILDIGCGAGELALAVAGERPDARITGLDVSPELISAAQARRDGVAAYNCEFVLGDAASWTAPGLAPDLLISRHGVMFFDDPVAAFAHLHQIAAPGARLVFSCFRDRADNHWASAMDAILDLSPPADPFAPGPFAFADRLRVAAILESAGWQHVSFEPVDFAYIAGAGDDPVADAEMMLGKIGPAAPALRALTGDALATARQRIHSLLQAHRVGNIVAFPAAAWIVTAAKG